MDQKQNIKPNPEIPGTCEGRAATWSRRKSRGFLFDDPIYQAFFDYCKYQRGLSENSIGAYFFDLRTYCIFLSGKGIPVRQVKVLDLDDFINYLGKILENSKRTIARKIVTLKSFYKYLYRIDEIETDIMKKIDSPRFKQALPRYLTIEQQRKLIEYFETRPERRKLGRWLKKRNRAIVLVLLDTGLRVSELCNIKIEDLDFDNRILNVKGKGEKESEVFLSDRVIETLRNYIKNVRPHLLRRGSVCKLGKNRFHVHVYSKTKGNVVYLKACRSKEEAERSLYEGLGPDKGYLFVRSGKKKLDTRHIYRILYLAGKALGFKVHPHLMRHTFASNLRRKGADLLLIKEALRHEDVSTTQIYTHISNERYKAEIGKYLN